VEAADEANTDFLRDSLEALDQASQSAAPRAYIDTQRDPRLASDTHPQTYVPRSRQETADDLSRRERLQRVLARLNHDKQSPVTVRPCPGYSNSLLDTHRATRTALTTLSFSRCALPCCPSYAILFHVAASSR
jgi:hypothetical protein